jgi:hypothetical protein
MTVNSIKPSTTTQWRKKKAALGFVRVEVQVHKEDAGLIREVAGALRHPARRDATRARLRDQLGTEPHLDFKKFLSSAPLQDIGLDREDDLGRDVDL